MTYLDWCCSAAIIDGVGCTELGTERIRVELPVIGGAEGQLEVVELWLCPEHADMIRAIDAAAGGIPS